MKKYLYIIAAVVLAIGIGLVAYLNNPEKDSEVQSISQGLVEQDKAHMDSIASDYLWYETCIKLTGTVDTLQSPDIEMLTNVFQVNMTDSVGTDTWVYGGKHLVNQCVSWWDEVHGFWVGDQNLRDFQGDLISFEEAWEYLQKANCPKPSSAYCTLRWEVGPKNVGPQWIFGNEDCGLVYVNAETGEVKTSNPVLGNIQEEPYLPEVPDTLKNFIFRK